MNWIPVSPEQEELAEFKENPTNILVCSNFDGVANVYWSEDFQFWMIETFETFNLRYPYVITHYIKLK